MSQTPPLFNQIETWQKKLPALRGKISFNEPLAKRNWFATGGVAEVFIEPADTEDLSLLLKTLPNEAITLLGGGSNVLIRDGGIPGITLHLGKGFADISLSGTQITCGAGALKNKVAQFAVEHALSGFEFLACIPGTIGGGIPMNAGCYGQEFVDILISLTAMTRSGELKVITEPANSFLAHRACLLPDSWIFLSATLQGTPANPEDIKKRIEENKTKKAASQPVAARTAGSTFKNPEGNAAWKLIEASGMRHASVGDACVSEKHANFLVNKGGATSAQIEQLGEAIRQKVLETSHIDLQWEIKRLGIPLSEENR